MKRLTQVVILLLVITSLPVLILFSHSTGVGHASALKPKPTPTPSYTPYPYPTPPPCPTPSSGGTWTLTGSLLVARYGIFTETVLQNGQMLVAGGYQVGTGAVLSEAELYTPSTGKWTTTGSMNDTREDQTATLLPNGQVLVAGGNDGNGPGGYTGSAELYTPSTSTWTNTGSMNLTRDLATATLLQNGQVLIAGGVDEEPSVPEEVFASAELYDPATGTLTTSAQTASMSTPRSQNATALLPSGKVLITGGGNSSGVLSSSELFNPVTDTFSLTVSMAAKRAGHTATLLQDGRVLITGGSAGSGSVLASAELYQQ